MEDNERLFASLIKEHKHTIYLVCYMFSQNEEDVKDLFQESLINLWKGFDSFAGRSAANTWVYRVCLNTCISHQRSEKRRKRAGLKLDVALADDAGDDSQVEMLHRRISRLRPLDRAIVLLWLEGISYDEIADIVGITPQNVGIRLFRIKEELKRM